MPNNEPSLTDEDLETFFTLWDVSQRSEEAYSLPDGDRLFTGLKTLDLWTLGLRSGEVYAFGAADLYGPFLLACRIFAHNVLKKDKSVTLCSSSIKQVEWRKRTVNLSIEASEMLLDSECHRWFAAAREVRQQLEKTRSVILDLRAPNGLNPSSPIDAIVEKDPLPNLILFHCHDSHRDTAEGWKALLQPLKAWATAKDVPVVICFQIDHLGGGHTCRESLQASACYRPLIQSADQVILFGRRRRHREIDLGINLNYFQIPIKSAIINGPWPQIDLFVDQAKFIRTEKIDDENLQPAEP